MTKDSLKRPANVIKRCCLMKKTDISKGVYVNSNRKSSTFIVCNFRYLYITNFNMNHNQKYVAIIMIYRCEVLVLMKFRWQSPFVTKDQDTNMLKNANPASKKWIIWNMDLNIIFLYNIILRKYMIWFVIITEPF